MRRRLWLRWIVLVAVIVIAITIVGEIRDEPDSTGLLSGLFLVLFTLGFPLGRSLRIAARIRALNSHALAVGGEPALEETAADENPPRSSDGILRGCGATIAILGGFGLSASLFRLLARFEVLGFQNIYRNAAAESMTWAWWDISINLLLGVLMVIGGIGVFRLKAAGRIVILVYCVLGIARLPVNIWLSPSTGWAAGGSCLVLVWYLMLLVIFARKDWRAFPTRATDQT